DGQYHGYRDQQLLLPRQAARFLRLLGSALFRRPARRMLSVFSIHCLSILSMRPAPQWWRGAQGFPFRSSLRWSSPG
ncbi:HTH cro/C1-type domain-containing protein, partial [Dysosmobacter welbionis]